MSQGLRHGVIKSDRHYLRAGLYIRDISGPADGLSEKQYGRTGQGGKILGNRAESQSLIDIGNCIREQRQESGLSQESLAELAGISSNTVSRIEGGQTAMSVEVFRKLVCILGMDANSLLGRTEQPMCSSGQLSEMFRRIEHLKKREQKIVMQTMAALMDGMEGAG